MGTSPSCPSCRNWYLPDNPSWTLQIIRLPKAFKLIFAEDKGEGDISSFAALATALAATIGTGNIVGVATAIKTGGPGGSFLDVDCCFLWYGNQIC